MANQPAAGQRLPARLRNRVRLRTAKVRRRLRRRDQRQPEWVVDASWSDDTGQRAAQVQVLLQAYATERTFDAQTTTTLTGVFATIIGILSLVGSLLAFESLHPAGLPEYLVIGLPVIPLPFLAWGAVCAHTIIARGEIIALYEAALRHYAQLRLHGTDAKPGLPVPFGSALIGRVWWARGSWPMSIAFFVIGLMYLGIVGVSAYFAWQRSFWFDVGVSFPSLFAFVFVILLTYFRAFNNPRGFVEGEAATVFGATVPFPPDLRQRSILWRTVGYRFRSFVVLALVACAAAAVAFYFATQRLGKSTPDTPATKPVLFAGQLGVSIGAHVVKIKPGDRPYWLVYYQDDRASDQPLCFQINPANFDLSNFHGFAWIRCDRAFPVLEEKWRKGNESH
ncbi:MAG TPA: hypothetical protein VFJ91_08070 [Gaiellaceae bacterium]|nr:hypothetical protein [Gaiellaceae bacterium]